MACVSCVVALERAGHVLYELVEKAAVLPPIERPQNYKELAEFLVRLAGELRLQERSTDLLRAG